MSRAIDLLDEALDLARKEKSALEDGEYDEAMGLAEKRGELTGMAWNLFEPSIAEHYKKRIMELSNIQKQLTELATKARDRSEERRVGKEC